MTFFDELDSFEPTESFDRSLIIPFELSSRGVVPLDEVVEEEVEGRVGVVLEGEEEETIGARERIGDV